MSSCESTLFAANIVPVRVVVVQVDRTPDRKRPDWTRPDRTRVTGHVCAITVQPIIQYPFLLPGIYRIISKGRLPSRTGVTRPLPPSYLQNFAGKTMSHTARIRSTRRPATFRSPR